jgi:hypothetical protein
MQLKGMCPDSRVPKSCLNLESKSPVERFLEVLEKDQVNDKIPE